MPKYQVKRNITLTWVIIEAKNMKEATEMADDLSEYVANMGPEKTRITKIKDRVPCVLTYGKDFKNEGAEDGNGKFN